MKDIMGLKEISNVARNIEAVEAVLEARRDIKNSKLYDLELIISSIILAPAVLVVVWAFVSYLLEL